MASWLVAKLPGGGMTDERFPPAKMSCITPKQTMITTKYWLFL